MNKVKECGNLLEHIQGDCDVHIYRVYGYESTVADRYYHSNSEWEPENESEEAVNKLFAIVEENVPCNWKENKMVVEIGIGTWTLFLGYWDSYYTMGFGVKPNSYPPKGNLNSWGFYESITINRK